MNYRFSANNALSEFESVETGNCVYIGFASEPDVNVFSHKFRGSQFGSSTEVLLDSPDRLRLENPAEATIVLHLVQGIVPLDGATASLAVELAAESSGDAVSGRQWDCLARYIGEMERGFTRPPFMRSLYAFYYATAMQALNRFPDEAQQDERNRFVLERYHAVLRETLAAGALDDFESPYRFFDIVPENISVAAQEEVLAHEQDRYFAQDYQRSDRFEIELPLKHAGAVGATRYRRVPVMVVPDPQSALFKFFARNPMAYPGEAGERSFPCTYVHNPHNRGRSSEHVVSVPPTADYHLKGLSELIETIEDRSRALNGEPERSRDAPRAGYAYDDPWYDERHSEWSILDNPRSGSGLGRDDVVEALWYFGSPLRHIRAGRVSTSIFIPFWPGNPEDFDKQQLQDNPSWEPWGYEPRYLQQFLPYMEQIFLETRTGGKRLKAYRCLQAPRLELAPQHLLEGGAAIDVVRERMLRRSGEILAGSNVELRAFTYEYGLGLLELRIDNEDGDISVFDTQWLEHCVTLTPVERLLDGVFDGVALNPLSPHKHFACTSLTGFAYEGGYLTEGRSTGGGIRMMVSDVEPLFRNLPLETRLVTDQTVIDETSKRYYYCSSTSLLNFDDSAPREEHELAHVASSAVFGTVLAQRFILAESRQEIVRAEDQDRQRRSGLTPLRWLAALFRRDRHDGRVDIGEVREKIQHLTTSAWFNVVSNVESVQDVFEKLRNQMKIPQFYEEVQDRTRDLDEYIAKKQSDVQSRVFTIFTFIMSPLNLVLGFVGGMGLATFANYGRSVPFLDIEDDISVFLVYFAFWSVIFAIVWMIYKYKSAKE